MFNNNLIHRDLKPENVFIHNDVFKIGNFEYCCFIKKDDEVNLE